MLSPKNKSVQNQNKLFVKKNHTHTTVWVTEYKKALWGEKLHSWEGQNIKFTDQQKKRDTFGIQKCCISFSHKYNPSVMVSALWQHIHRMKRLFHNVNVPLEKNERTTHHKTSVLKSRTLGSVSSSQSPSSCKRHRSSRVPAAAGAHEKPRLWLTLEIPSIYVSHWDETPC